MDERGKIIFRDGPTGLRAAIAGGPDVWELMATLKQGKAQGEKAVSETAELLGLTELQVRTGVRYYRAYPEEIDERIARNVEEADVAEVAWRRERSVPADL